MEVLTVYASTVRRGDIVNIERTQLRVRDMLALHGGRKRLFLDNGMTVVLDTETPLIARRAAVVRITS
ncbi:hypothetical protein [Streptomyces sp. NPDC018031]|uniref:hypothetical protein n=1 Tax=Streptomyces sp. NPDC018031 TaxID=3365033 RepID=UPI0037971683